MKKYYKYGKPRLIGILHDRDEVISNYKESTDFKTHIAICTKSADRYDEILALEKELLLYKELCKKHKLSPYVNGYGVVI